VDISLIHFIYTDLEAGSFIDHVRLNDLDFVTFGTAVPSCLEVPVLASTVGNVDSETTLIYNGVNITFVAGDVCGIYVDSEYRGDCTIPISIENTVWFRVNFMLPYLEGVVYYHDADTSDNVNQGLFGYGLYLTDSVNPPASTTVSNDCGTNGYMIALGPAMIASAVLGYVFGHFGGLSA